MPLIVLKTYIQAERSIVFDLSRSIDLHKISTQQTNEEAISGITSGLIGMNESVTWRAKHLGFYQELTSKITAFNSPYSFTDEMVSGAFKQFKHEHIFEEHEQGTLMVDRFDYTSPLGILGKIADSIFLKKYMTNLLITRNESVKEFAESDRWKEILS